MICGDSIKKPDGLASFFGVKNFKGWSSVAEYGIISSIITTYLNSSVGYYSIAPDQIDWSCQAWTWCS